MKTEQETETNTPPPTNGETAAVEESRRVRPKWLVPLVAGLCALALVVAGGIGWKIWSDRRLAEAKAACATASDAARGAMNDWNTLVNGDAADLLEVKADQVKDAKTIDALKTALDVEAPEYEGCVADGKDGLETAIDELDDAAAWYEKHAGSLKKAVDAVNDSKLAKTIDTAKTLLESSNGNVQDDKTREELSKAIEAKDEAAIAKASKAVNDSIAAKQKADEEAKAKAQAEAAPDPQKFVAMATFSAVQQEAAQLRDELTKLKNEAQAAALKDDIEAALKDGRLTVATKGWAESLAKTAPDALKAYLAAQPPVRALAGTQTGGTPPAGDKPGTVSLTAEEQHICERLGLTREEFIEARQTTEEN